MRSISRCLVIIIVSAFVAVACSDDSSSAEICGNGVDDDNNGKKDCEDPACAASCGTDAGPDGPATDGPAPEPDTGTDTTVIPPDAGASALQSVIRRLYLPKSNQEYAVDLDGTGPKNQLGGILAAISGFMPQDPQIDLDKQLDDGKLILLLDLRAADLVNAASAAVQAYQGIDKDNPPDPTNNFSGSGEFTIDPAGPQDATLAGSITGGKLESKGTVLVPIPLDPTTTTIVTLTKAQITADVAGTGMTNGVIAGAIPQDQVDNKVLPAIATMLNGPGIDPTVKAIFDANGDGTVTAQELKDNLLLKLVLQADIDTNGDNAPDAMSIGLGFESVSCLIVP